MQQAISDFTTQFENMVASYRSQNKYPVNGPLEIRVTGLDDETGMPSITGGSPGRPVISAIAADDTTRTNKWDVAVWFDVLCLPGTQYSLDFYSELEQWMTSHYTAPNAKVVPEWSKGWAYTPQGAWQNTNFIAGIKEGFTKGRAQNDNWQWEVQTLKGYDAANIYQSPLTRTLFS